MNKLDIHRDIREKLDSFYKNNNVPHMLFYGPHGSGKKTIVNDYINKIYPIAEARRQNVMKINCALGKGIQFIREDIKQFAKSHVFSKNKFKIIMLYNADRLTVDAQSALRRCIEVFSKTTRFFIILENKQQLLRPILSRLCDIYIYFPLINNKHVNLHNYFKDKYRKSNTEYDKHLKNKNIQFNRIISKCSDEEINFFNIVEEMYDKGYSSYDIVNYYKTSNDIKIYYHTIKESYKNEKLLMLYLLYLIFRMKDDLEIFDLIT
jgi:replication-associated recombination protein RarA